MMHIILFSFLSVKSIFADMYICVYQSWSKRTSRQRALYSDLNDSLSTSNHILRFLYLINCTKKNLILNYISHEHRHPRVSKGQAFWVSHRFPNPWENTERKKTCHKNTKPKERKRGNGYEWGVIKREKEIYTLSSEAFGLATERQSPKRQMRVREKAI